MQNHPKILSIQALRGIAAALVVIFHAQALLLKFTEHGAFAAWLNSTPGLRSFGGIGVDLFFVISGTVITYVSWDLFGKPGEMVTFLKKRIIRIFPVYWLNLLLWVIVFAFFANALTSQPIFNPVKVLCSFFLLPYPDGVHTGFGELYTLGMAWTLTYEMYFYAVTALCLCFARKWFLPIVCFFFLAGHVFFFPSVKYPILTVLSGPKLLEFVYGILIACALRLRLRVPAALALAILLISPLPLLYGTSPLMSVGLSIALFVFSVVFLERSGALPIPRGLVLLGDCSYSLYLFHGIVQSALGKILTLTNLWSALPADLYIVIISLISIAAGYLAYICTEKPMNAWLSRRFIPERASRLHSGEALRQSHPEVKPLTPTS